MTIDSRIAKSVNKKAKHYGRNPFKQISNSRKAKLAMSNAYSIVNTIEHYMKSSNKDNKDEFIKRLADHFKGRITFTDKDKKLGLSPTGKKVIEMIEAKKIISKDKFLKDLGFKKDVEKSEKKKKDSYEKPLSEKAKGQTEKQEDASKKKASDTLKKETVENDSFDIVKELTNGAVTEDKLKEVVTYLTEQEKLANPEINDIVIKRKAETNMMGKMSFKFSIGETSINMIGKNSNESSLIKKIEEKLNSIKEKC